MAPARRIPGETLVARVSLRMTHASGLAAGGRLAQRLAERSALQLGGPRPISARVDRWQRSPLLAWAGVLLGEAPSPAFAGLMAPTAVFALPEPPAEADVQPAARPSRRSPRAATRRRAAPSVTGSPATPASPASARAGSAPRSVARTSVLHRSAQRGERVQREPVSPRSVWAQRVLAPNATLAQPMQPTAASATPARRGAEPPREGGPLRAVAPPHPVPRASRLVRPERRLAQPDASSAAPSQAASPVSGPPPATAFDRLEQRHSRPAGVVAGRMRSASQPVHPTARGLDAVRMEPVHPDTPGAERSSEPDDTALPLDAIEAPTPAVERHPARAMLHALARAGSPQEAARVVVDGAQDVAAVRALPAPLAEVVKQIQRQVQAATAKAAVVTPSGRLSDQARARERSDQKLPSAALRLGRGNDGQSGSGEVVSLATMRLLRRLQQLVHIAEVDRRQLEAQRRVRMAEDSAHARAEGSATPGTDSAGEAQPVDLDTLGREVLAAVTDKLSTRNDRRLEDPDVPIDVF